MAKKPKYTKAPKKLYVLINEWGDLDATQSRRLRSKADYSGQTEAVYVLEKVTKQMELDPHSEIF